MTDDPSPAAKFLALLTSSALSLALAELVVRWADGGALASPRMYVATPEDPGVALRPHADVSASGAGRVVRIQTDAAGIRLPRPDEASWLVVGDSQVLGLGVAGAQTFVAGLTDRGLPAWNAGVVAYGVEDAVAHALVLSSQHSFAGVIVVANRANDWEEVGAPVGRRFDVVDGWLLPPDAASPLRLVFSTGAARLHVVHHAARALSMGGAAPPAPPRWLVDPVADAFATDTITRAVERLARARPGLRVVLMELPIDLVVAPARRGRSSLAARFPEADVAAWRTRRGSLAGEGRAYTVVDVDPGLRDRPEAFLDGDYHLSEAGHDAVAEVLAASLTAP